MSQVPEDHWVYEEMRRLELGDKRLEARTIKIIHDLSQKPTASIPEFCEDGAAVKGVYGYCRNKGVAQAAIVEAQRQATLGRIRQGEYQRVLSVQDTTEYNYSHHPATQGLGPLDNAKVQGFFAHSSLAVTTEGLPLGLLGQEVWVRQASPQPSAKDRPIEAKESYKWLKGLHQSSRDLPAEVQLIQVSDQESDIYEYLVEPRPANVELLVRSYQTREAMDDSQSLRSRLRTSPVRGKVEVEVTKTPTQPARLATCQVYYEQVKLRPPRPRPGLPPDLKPVRLSAVLIREMNPPDGLEGLEWLLLTTLAVLTFEQACEIIRYYTLRWLVERFHFVLKSGCALEDRQFLTADRLQRFLALANVVAWRLLWLTYLGRGQPDLPCTAVLAADEWRALYAYHHKTALLPDQPPSLQQAILWLARLGGFLGRKSDGHPGVKVLWRGWLRLADIVQTWLIFNST
jgi:Transposase Tn5 dimerisation domain/Transposase DNA-binding